MLFFDRVLSTLYIKYKFLFPQLLTEVGAAGVAGADLPPLVEMLWFSRLEDVTTLHLPKTETNVWEKLLQSTKLNLLLAVSGLC